MHKSFRSILAAVLSLAMLSSSAIVLAADRHTTVLLGGGILTTEAYVDGNGRTQIPAEVARKVGVTKEYAPGSAVGDTVAVEGYVPLRAAFTEAGYSVDWDSKTGNVSLGRPDVSKINIKEGKAPDYAQRSSWYQIPEITKDVDTFYIYSTAYVESSFLEGSSDYAPLDNLEMVLGAYGEYLTNASVYEESTNVFVPYYRQAGMRFAGEIREKTGDIDSAISGVAYEDMSAALDYYFEHYNNGRPFIIAGHSQGSAMTLYVLKHYFKEHPDYYKRMVAAYAIGYSITRDDLEAYPHLKFATGENDTGVVISWNTEGRQNVEENAKNAVVLPGEISINPLNWKLDDTYAPAGENLGSLVFNEETGRYEIGDVGADAQLVPGRGVILTNTTAAPTDMAEFFGPQSYHEDDYTLYYNNIKDNVAKRVAAYQAGVAGAPDYTKEECWYQIPEITKDVDTFYIYATEYIMGSLKEGAPDYATLDNEEMREGAASEYILHATAFANDTNVFMPYYRQSGLRHLGEVWKANGTIDAGISGMCYDDVTAALDYYFEHYNEGRPFIIAGHSQGSAITLLVLKNYFKEHPEYYKRMVAAYPIGYSVTRDDLEKYPHLKFATGETDTGVIISWNTEGPGNAETNASTAVLLPNAMSINPLNWKLDDTYAPASENLGSTVALDENGEPQFADIGADARVDTRRGVVVTNAPGDEMDEEQAKVAAEFFGPDGRHGNDYSLFFNNIKENVGKRVAAYLADK